MQMDPAELGSTFNFINRFFRYVNMKHEKYQSDPADYCNIIHTLLKNNIDGAIPILMLCLKCYFGNFLCVSLIQDIWRSITACLAKKNKIEIVRCILIWWLIKRALGNTIFSHIKHERLIFIYETSCYVSH